MTYPNPSRGIASALSVLPPDRQLATAAIAQVFRAQSLLLNPGRLDLLDVLFDAQEALDVEGALAAARAKGSEVSRAAVTRFLSLLTRLGIAEVVGRRNTRRFYRLRRQTRTITLTCVRERKIIEVEDHTLVAAVEKMLEDRGYRLVEGIDFCIEPVPARAEHPFAAEA